VSQTCAASMATSKERKRSVICGVSTDRPNRVILMIRVYDEAGNLVETHAKARGFWIAILQGRLFFF
jgi:hypothetical protein